MKTRSQYKKEINDMLNEMKIESERKELKMSLEEFKKQIELERFYYKTIKNPMKIEEMKKRGIIKYLQSADEEVYFEGKKANF
jgi:ribosomal protein L22